MELMLKTGDLINIKGDNMKICLGVDLEGKIFIVYKKNHYKLDTLLEKKESKSKEYEIGDEVVIHNQNYAYTTYFDWARKHIPDGYNWNNRLPDGNVTYKIICKEKHGIQSDIMCYGVVKNNGWNTKTCYIVEEKAFKKEV